MLICFQFTKMMYKIIHIWLKNTITNNALMFFQTLNLFSVYKNSIYNYNYPYMNKMNVYLFSSVKMAS